MAIDTQGAPSHISLVPVNVPFTEVGKWELVVDGVSVDVTGKNLIEALDSLKATYGIYAEQYNLPSNLFIRNISELDHILDITYTGDVDFSNPLADPLFSTPSAIIGNAGKTYSFALGGYSNATVWLYPSQLSVESYEDAGKQKLYALGNAYAIELDGIKYTDNRDLEASKSYGSLTDVITQNQLDNILAVSGQQPIAGNSHNVQLVNIDDKSHTVKVYVDKSKPMGNLNAVAGTMTELYQGKAIYCKDDSYVGSPEYGSVNNRVVDEKGFSMVLASKALPPITVEHSFDDVIDTRLETIITLTGSATVEAEPNTDIDELNIGVIVGDTLYSPGVSVAGNVYTWELAISSKTFTGAKFYSVIVTRLGGINAHHVNQKYYAVNTISQFTDYDTQALEATTVSKFVNNGSFNIPNVYTTEEIAAMKYVAGTRSSSTAKQLSITESPDNLVIPDFVSTWLAGNTDTPTGTNVILTRTIGEIGIMHLPQAAKYSLDLVSNAEVPLETPLYDSSQFDYAYVAITGLKEAVFENSMFSAENAGQCFYIEETDTNLWILRV